MFPSVSAPLMAPIKMFFIIFPNKSRNNFHNIQVWHILSVQTNSPAELAGLQANTDYVLGAESVLQQADDLIALVQANIGKPMKVCPVIDLWMTPFPSPLQLYVYNVDTDNVREVTLVPNYAWGGEGCLGCDIGYGYLHRIPVSVDRSQPLGNEKMLLLAPTVNQGEQESKKPSNAIHPAKTGIPQVDQLISVGSL